MLLIMSRLFSISMLAVFLSWTPYVFPDGPSPTPGSEQESGIEGMISVGPIHGGPTRQGVPDSKPLADTEFKVEKQDGVVMSFKTDSEGRFRISLPAGHYTISKKDGTAAIGHYSFEVDLTPGQVKHVQWKCDTGI